MGNCQIIEAALLRNTAQTINCLMVRLMTVRIFVRIHTVNEVSVQFHMSLLLYSQSIPRRRYIDAQSTCLLLPGIMPFWTHVIL